jgi:hypothetical protein
MAREHQNAPFGKNMTSFLQQTPVPMATEEPESMPEEDIGFRKKRCGLNALLSLSRTY